MLEAQSSFVTSEATDQDASLQRCSLNDGDVVCNADLYLYFYVFNHKVDNGKSFIRLIMRRLRDIHVWLVTIW